jgi:metacaspase-1
VKKIFLTALTLFFAFTGYSQVKPEKHALIIAIGNYPTDTTGWPDISSANDIGLMKTALEYQGFKDVDVLQDKLATKEGIIKAFNNLTSKVKSGDIVIVHISSHGQQVQDYEKDESDGLDEAIVAYDAPSDQAHAGILKDKYKGEKHFKDDDFGKLVDTLRIKLGASGDLVVFIDACHSGTGTRGDAKVRGGFPALVATGYVEMLDTATKKKEVFLYEKSISDAPKAHYVVFSAARANELNYEYKLNKTGYGSLSFALSKALTETDKDATYRSLFANVLAIMTTIAPNQNPTVEGEIDRGLFGGSVVAQEPYQTINTIKNPKTIIINGGLLGGIYDSSKVAVFPVGTLSIDGVNPLTSGYVVSSGNLTSTVILKDSLKIKNKNEAWVFVTEKTTGDIMLKVLAEKFDDKNLQTIIENDLKANPIVEMVNDSADLVVKDFLTRGASGLMTVKRASDGVILDTVTKENLDSLLLTYAQGKFIKEFDLKDSTVRLEMEFVPVIVDDNGKITFLDIKDYMSNGTPEFDTTATLMIKIKNKGKKDAYFNIIDIQPDGKINAVLPSLDPEYKESPEYFLVKAGKEWIIPDYVVSFSPPYGKEIYKVFGTRTSIDLSFAVNNRGVGKRGSEQAIEKLFQKTYSEEIYSGSRGTPRVTRITSSSGVNTFDYMFIIKEK